MKEGIVPTMLSERAESSEMDVEEDQTLLNGLKSTRHQTSRKGRLLYKHWMFICVQLLLLCAYTTVFFAFQDATAPGLPPASERVYCKFSGVILGPRMFC
jgi:hypothetical protein